MSLFYMRLVFREEGNMLLVISLFFQNIYDNSLSIVYALNIYLVQRELGINSHKHFSYFPFDCYVLSNHPSANPLPVCLSHLFSEDSLSGHSGC